jgi:integrase
VPGRRGRTDGAAPRGDRDLGFAGLRVSELCALNKQDIDLPNRRIYVRDSKTPAGVRVIDIRPSLHDELSQHRARVVGTPMDGPAFPTATGRRRDRNNVLV